MLKRRHFKKGTDYHATFTYNCNKNQHVELERVELTSIGRRVLIKLPKPHLEHALHRNRISYLRGDSIQLI